MKKKKVLVIDDERGFTKMVKLNLEASGDYEVKIQNNSLDALQTAIEFQPDVILLDVIMPDLEGPDVVYQIKNNEVLKNTPVIFITANITREEVEAQEGYIGGHAFLAKPGSIDELIACIEKQIKSHP
ncbi:MAG: response regulator [Candidatus Omnitrophica bacterium]|nr:response regulator [Candidatus Omnitrophota bacterium]